MARLWIRRLNPEPIRKHATGVEIPPTAEQVFEGLYPPPPLIAELRHLPWWRSRISRSPKRPRIKLIGDRPVTMML